MKKYDRIIGYASFCGVCIECKTFITAFKGYLVKRNKNNLGKRGGKTAFLCERCVSNNFLNIKLELVND